MNFLLEPFRWLLGLLRGFSEIFELLLQSLGGGGRVPDDENPSRPWWKTILLLPILVPYWLWTAFFTILSYPLSLSSLGPRARIAFLLGCPAILVFLATIGIAIFSFISTNKIDDRYRNQMNVALAIKDYNQAKLVGNRLFEPGKIPDPEIKFRYAIALDQTGESERASRIIEELAPDDSPGYYEAHRIQAMTVASRAGKSPDEKLLERLRWHLEHSGEEPNVAIEQLWGSYFMTVNQPSEAAKHLEIAAKMDPKIYLALSELYQKSGNTPGESRALRAAEDHFSKKLRDDPLLREERLLLALVQSRMNNIEAAENTVLTGVRLHPDAKMKREASSFFIVRYDKIAQSDPEDLTTQMRYIENSLALDVNNLEIYNRMITLYGRAKDSEEGAKIRGMLESMISEGKSPALGHFALSSIYLLERNSKQAEFHLNQSYKLNPNLPVVTNNLAWMLAHSEDPDLDRAMDLVQSAIRYAPEVISFRDTLATILMKQGKLDLAIAEYERILAQLPDPRVAHRKLADMYKQLDQPSLAKLHEDKAK